MTVYEGWSFGTISPAIGTGFPMDDGVTYYICCSQVKQVVRKLHVLESRNCREPCLWQGQCGSGCRICRQLAVASSRIRFFPAVNRMKACNQLSRRVDIKLNCWNPV